MGSSQLIFFPRKHADAHPFGLSVGVARHSSVTLTFHGGEEGLRAPLEHGSDERELLRIKA